MTDFETRKVNEFSVSIMIRKDDAGYFADATVNFAIAGAGAEGDDGPALQAFFSVPVDGGTIDIVAVEHQAVDHARELARRFLSTDYPVTRA